MCAFSLKGTENKFVLYSVYELNTTFTSLKASSVRTMKLQNKISIANKLSTCVLTVYHVIICLEFWTLYCLIYV